MTCLAEITAAIRDCRLCAERFAGTVTAHAPRPVVRVGAGAPILIVGQAPGARVHASGLPFDDPSGDRLRDWMGIDRTAFYDTARVSIVPMAFCFPGYDARGADLPPPKLCAETWRARLLGALAASGAAYGDTSGGTSGAASGNGARLTLVIGQYAQAWHLPGPRRGVTETVRRWRDHTPGLLPLPHPSWRNTAWLKRNPWFAEEVLPWLRARVADLLPSRS